MDLCPADHGRHLCGRPVAGDAEAATASKWSALPLPTTPTATATAIFNNDSHDHPIHLYLGHGLVYLFVQQA